LQKKREVSYKRTRRSDLYKQEEVSYKREVSPSELKTKAEMQSTAMWQDVPSEAVMLNFPSPTM